MFYLSKDKSKILDYTDRGLTAMQLEHISELLQKSTGQFA